MRYIPFVYWSSNLKWSLLTFATGFTVILFSFLVGTIQGHKLYPSLESVIPQQIDILPQGLIAVDSPVEVVVETIHVLHFQLTDAAGQPLSLANVPVQFLVNAPAPRRDGLRSTTLCAVQDNPEITTCVDQTMTDANGQLMMTLTTGQTAGLIQLIALVGDLGAIGTFLFEIASVGSRDNAVLMEVSGNAQVSAPGQTLEEPLLVRIEDQFGNPIANEEVTALVVEGEAVLSSVESPLPPTTRSRLKLGGNVASQGTPVRQIIGVTNAQGEVRFLLQIGDQERDRVVVEILTAEIPQAEPVQFITLIGFPFPTDIAVEASGSLVITDGSLRSILRVDPQTGQRTIVSGQDIGGGPPFGLLTGIVVEADGTFVVAYAAGSLANMPAVVRVDPRTGDRSVVAGGNRNIGSGPSFLSPSRIALEENGSLILIDNFSKAVMRIVLETGERHFVSNASPVGNGILFMSLFDIAVGLDGNLIVLDNERRALIQVDPNNGDRTILSGDSVGVGIDFENPIAVTVGANGSLFVADDGRTTATEKGRKNVFRIDRNTGARTIVSGNGPAVSLLTGDGPEFLVLTAIAALSNNDIIVGDSGRGAILQVEPIRGDRTVISEARFGSGPSLASPWRLALEAEGSLVVIDDVLDAIMRIDPTTGDRTIISDEDGAGRGPPLVNPIAIEVEADGTLVVADEGADALMRINPHNGERFVVSGGESSRGSGPPLLNPTALTIASDGRFLTATLGGEQLDGSIIPPAIVSIEPQSGNRVVLSGGTESRGSGLALRNPLGIALEADGTIIVVDCGGSCLFPLPPTLDFSIPPAVLRINPDTGARTAILGGSFSLDVDLLTLMPTDVDVHDDGHLFVVGGSFVSAAVTQIDPESGVRTLVSGVTALGNMAGRGQALTIPFGIAVTRDNIIMVADVILGAIVAVDPKNGVRTIVSK